MIQDQKLNEMQKEKGELLRDEEKQPENNEIKRQIKNLNERIRVRSNKLVEKPKLAEEIKPAKTPKKNGRTMKYVVSLMKHQSAKEIAEKTGYPIKSVRWYLWQFKTNSTQ